MKDYLSRAFALTFTAAISERLISPKVVGVGVPRLPFTTMSVAPVLFRAEGHLALRTHRESGETIVPVQILISHDWVTTPPIVYSAAQFIRKEGDWHIQTDGRLCHVLPNHWAWEVNKWWGNDFDIDTIVQRAANWCVLNVDSLITRHLHGQRFGITKWPKQWDQWSHGTIGIMEFQSSIHHLTGAAA